MSLIRALARVCAFCFLGLVTASVSAQPTTEPQAASLTIGVADFSGPDMELGRFIADTLLTDLAQSRRLMLVERAEIGQALIELKLQSTGLIEPEQVQQLGKLVGADRLIVGSFRAQGEQILINARLLDVQSGRLVVGGGANVIGAREAIFSLIHHLAHLLHQRLTGEDIELDGDTSLPEEKLRPAAPPRPSAPPTRLRSGLIPEGELPGDEVSERELLELCDKIAWRLGTPGQPLPAGKGSNQAVNRLYALTVIVNTALSLEKIEACGGRPFSVVPPDVKRVPWRVVPYIKAAIGQGWWPANRAILPAEKATWEFVGSLLVEMPLLHSVPAPEAVFRPMFAAYPLGARLQAPLRRWKELGRGSRRSQ